MFSPYCGEELLDDGSFCRKSGKAIELKRIEDMRAMRTCTTLCALLIATQLVAFSQSSSTRIASVTEPPELTGEPKKVTPPTDTERQFLTKVTPPTDWKDAEKLKTLKQELDEFIQKNPDYSDARFIRAMGSLCFLGSKDYDVILKDIDAAISTHSSLKQRSAYENIAGHYSLRAKIKFDTGRYRDAMDDLDTAIRTDVSSADKIFNTEGVEPETKSSPCTWSKTDLDGLAVKFPKDYRVHIYRGLYLNFFVTFKRDYYQQAIQEFQKASALNPQSCLPHYFIGHLYTRSSMWLPSDSAKSEARRKAAQAYTKAIELDPKFLPAYELRADSYYYLKQSREAIKDYDRVLELDPENVTAYHDRALAKMDLGQHHSAILDFGDAIKRRKPAKYHMYENRAGAHMKVGDYRSAVSDLNKAIELYIALGSNLMNIRQFRALYPEYKELSDDALCRKIHNLFFPDIQYEGFAKGFLHERERWPSTILPDLYVKRGDAYLKLTDFRKAIAEYNRAFNGFPDYATVIERWRLLGSTANEEYYLDVKTVEFSTDGPAKVWLKATNKKSTYTVQAYEVDCAARRIKLTSTVVYHPDGYAVKTAEMDRWDRIVPGTTGEALYSGLCSTGDGRF